MSTSLSNPAVSVALKDDPQVRTQDGRGLGRTLAKLIREGKLAEGDALPSERQLALELQVSRASVRKALIALEDEGLVEGGHGRVRRVRRPVGSASLMASTILIVGLDSLPHKRLPYETGWDTYAQFAATARLQSMGYHCLAINPQTASAQQLAQMRNDGPAGVLVAYHRPSEQTQSTLDQLQSMGLMGVTYGSSDHDGAWDVVYHDHAAGAEALTQWLIGKGCRRIQPFWRFPDHRNWVTQREQGYCQAMQAAGLTPLVPVRTADLRVSGREEQFDDAVRLQMGFLHEALLGDEPVDALMCANDLHAAEAAEVVRRLGKTPGEDVLITGYDNTWQRDNRNPDRIDPPAATIDKANARVGEALVDLLLQRIKGDLPAQPQRRSTAHQLITPHV